VPSDALVVVAGNLVLATDLGVFVAPAGHGAATAWSRLGSGLPNASVNDLTVTPDGVILAATHGRGIWSITL
jgi:sugar lactone lactonase YvrE